MSPESPEVPVQRAFTPLLFLLFLAFIKIITPFIPVSNLWDAVTVGLILTVIYVGGVVGFGLSVAKAQYPIAKSLLFLGLAVLTWVTIQYGLIPFFGRHLMEIYQSGVRPTDQQRFPMFASVSFQELAMVSGATMAGTILSRMIRHPNMIGPIGAAIALIDIWGVLFGGPVSQLLASKAVAPIAEKALAAGPTLRHVQGTPASFHVGVPSIGVGDFLFIALLLSVLVTLKMNWKSSARWMGILVTLTLLPIIFGPLFRMPDIALPGLLPIGAAAVLPNLKYFRFTREENFALLYAGILVLILTIGIYFGLKRALPPNPETPHALKQP